LSGHNINASLNEKEVKIDELLKDKNRIYCKLK